MLLKLLRHYLAVLSKLFHRSSSQVHSVDMRTRIL
jgi:hypothetical protein